MGHNFYSELIPFSILKTKRVEKFGDVHLYIFVLFFFKEVLKYCKILTEFILLTFLEKY